MRPIQVFLVHGDLEELVSTEAWLDGLDGPDLVQYERFRHAGARAQFLTGRWLMRRVLEDAGLNWGDVDRTHEKFTHPGAHFNLSHVDGLVGLALDFESPIGFDVEWLGRGTNRAQLMPRQFVPEEIAWVEMAESDDEHRARFFKLWTIKEAILKAEACGLRVDTRGMKVGVEEGTVETRFEQPWDLYTARLADHTLSVATPIAPRDVIIRVWSAAGWTPIDLSFGLLRDRRR